jgi:hypothetical protein
MSKVLVKMLCWFWFEHGAKYGHMVEQRAEPEKVDPQAVFELAWKSIDKEA